MQTRDGSNVELAPRKVSDIDKKVGERVRVRREMLGLSQADLGRRCNISPQQIHKYETGESGMRASRIVQFSAALGVLNALDSRYTTPAGAEHRLVGIPQDGRTLRVSVKATF